ncbi:MAG: CPBP family intramembrane metalloprotease [Limnothrix sp. CACIAM 69d]|nr:MAG: CPBP family intramembrane metalloprotease [Limnothrix sp. CACIAM 69d]
MTGSGNFKRLVLVVLTVLALSVSGLSLVGSFTQTQIQSRLELYQINLMLRATGELDLPPDRPAETDDPIAVLRQQLLGDRTFADARQQYQAFRQKAALNAEKLIRELTIPANNRSANSEASSEASDLATAGPDSDFDQLAQQLRELAAVDLRLGLLQARLGESAAALTTWQQLARLSSSLPDSIDPQSFLSDFDEIRDNLALLWGNRNQITNQVTNQVTNPNAPALPPAIAQGIEDNIRQFLGGWFRNASLARLYRLQQRPAELSLLAAETNLQAESLLLKLAAVNLIPSLALLCGIISLIVLLVQRFLKGSNSLLSLASVQWTVPWAGETIWEVFILGFFAIGQIVVPLIRSIGLQLLGIQPSTLTGGTQAGIILFSYGLMAAGSVLTLRYAVKSYLPLPEGWFQFNWQNGRWLAWGIGGYCVALPIVILVSLANQQIWQGQGGSNPILSIVLENRDPVAITCFFLTASIAAPLFEETLFRGFLLPSLTRYLPPWGAIGLSSLIFALAHLSLSEVLPLTTLGIVLGVVYARSRNLLSSILLHGLWNSGTLASLILLSSR